MALHTKTTEIMVVQCILGHAGSLSSSVLLFSANRCGHRCPLRCHPFDEEHKDLRSQPKCSGDLRLGKGLIVSSQLQGAIGVAKGLYGDTR